MIAQFTVSVKQHKRDVGEGESGGRRVDFDGFFQLDGVEKIKK